MILPKSTLFADFETYWSVDYSISKMNTSSYVRDPRFKAHMLGVQLDDGAPDVIEGKEIPKYLKHIKWDSTGLCCHNMAFDGFICSHHYGIIPAYYYDTLAMGRILNGADIPASLASLAPAYGVGNKTEGVLTRSKGVLNLHDVPGLYEDMALYCGVDVNVMYRMFNLMLAGKGASGLRGKPFPKDELDLIHITARMFCDPVLRMDLKLLREARDEEVARKTDIFERALCTRDFEKAKTLMGSKEGFAQALRSYGIEPPTKWSEKQQKEVYGFAKADLEPLLEELDEDDPAHVLIEAKLETSSNISVTRAERFLALGEKGLPAPAGYNYGIAHTHRWGGANKTNFQNMKRGSKLRRSIQAPPNHILVVRDSAQIEARVIAKLAECTWRLDAFREGIDLYVKSAAGIYHIPEQKIITDLASGSGAAYDAAKQQRQIGKVAELALGFQGAAGAFNSMAKNYGVVLPDKEVRGIVKAWRKDNPEIVQLWNDVSEMLAMMVAGQKGTFDIFKFEGSKAGGRILMPNGLYLKYPQLNGEIHPRKGTLNDGTFLYKGVKKYIYGGSCTENLVQCIARIVVGEQILRAERHPDFIKAKARTVLITHDESVTAVHKSAAQDIDGIMEESFGTPPTWWPDLPVTSSGEMGVRYEK